MLAIAIGAMSRVLMLMLVLVLDLRWLQTLLIYRSEGTGLNRLFPPSDSLTHCGSIRARAPLR
jgi:hypothetical protein